MTASGYLLYLKRDLGIKKYWALQIILQVPILLYAITYFLNLGLWPNYLQKPAFLALFGILLYCSWTAKNKSSDNKNIDF